MIPLDTHCTCEGEIIESTREYEGSHSNYCLGTVKEQWETGGNIVLRIHASPPNAKLTVKENSTVEHDCEEGAKCVNLFRQFEIRGGKVKFEKNLPIHVKLSHPGYKTLKKQITPDGTIIDLKVPLVPEKQ